MVDWYQWAAFLSGLLALLTLDLRVFHRNAHEPSLREAAAWTGVWVSLAVAFAGLLWAWKGGRYAGEFLAGYLIEWSLSVDNVFVFILVFTHFAVPRPYQHRVLFWGVLGAIVMRLGFVLGGAALIDRFHWIVYVFGALLLITAVRFLREREGLKAVGDSAVVRVVRRVLPVTDGYRGQRLFVRESGRRLATPLMAVLLVIEATDIAFAIDSIPAIFAVTRETFLVFASNALAILGLRSLYFVLSGAMVGFRYVRPALAALLVFVGTKMLLSEVVYIPLGLSLGLIVMILGAGVLASVAGRRSSIGITSDGGRVVINRRARVGEAAGPSRPDQVWPGSPRRQSDRGPEPRSAGR